MEISFELEDKSYGTANITKNSSSFTLFYPCDSVSSCTNYISFFPPGIYIFEVWGGSGGLNGGLGGYSKGKVQISSRTKIRIFIGSKGDALIEATGFSQTSFNGGGKGYSAHSDANPRSTSSGGGSTDVRFKGASIFHRVLVAGGGGGGVSVGSVNYFGGDGGGERGFKKNINNNYGEGANQTSPGIGEFEFNSAGEGRYSGIFGHGGQGNHQGTHGGGGGGWFGGSSSRPANAGGGGGGSGYALNQTSFKPDNYEINNPMYFFYSSEVSSGQDTFPSCFNNLLIEEGHVGNGCARITVVYASNETYKTCLNPHILVNIFLLFVVFLPIFVIS